MTVLVIGGTGTVGGQVARQLIEKGVNVHILTRSEEKSKEVPQGAQGVVGDLEQPSTLTHLFKGIDAVFLCNALSQTETQQGLAAVEAAQGAGVRRIVYSSVHHVREASHIPHFGSKIPVEDAIMASGMGWTILRPNNFFQNDFWFQDAMKNYGIYPQPIGDIGLNRVDVRDIADAAVAALTTSDYEGQIYPLVGSDVLTAADTVSMFSRHLGRDIQYGGNDLESWAQQSKAWLPEWLVHDLRIMYGDFQERGLLASEEDFAKQREILGHEPRSFDAFVQENVAFWTL